MDQQPTIITLKICCLLNKRIVVMILCVAEKQGCMLNVVLRLFLITKLLHGLNFVYYVYACITLSCKLLECFVF